MIALATSVGACTYLMGTYHGYNSGKAHVVEEQLKHEQAVVIPSVSSSPVAIRSATAAVPKLQPDGVNWWSHLLPFIIPLLASFCNPIHCDSNTRCRLVELTQYHCDLQKNRVLCQPIDRIFRM